MLIQYVLFDLDGTLTDSMLGIINCAHYALEKFDIHPLSRKELLPYIGPPLLYSFAAFHGLDREQAEQAVVYYRERFSTIGWQENEVYEGVPELLGELKKRGVTLMVATSKPDLFTHRILERFDLAKYFTFVAASTMDETRSEKADVIAYLLEKHPEISAKNCVMVGDRKYDVLGAHQCGLPAVGVLYGYGDRKEMEESGADFIVNDLSDLENLLFEII